MTKHSARRESGLLLLGIGAVLVGAALLSPAAFEDSLVSSHALEGHAFSPAGGHVYIAIVGEISPTFFSCLVRENGKPLVLAPPSEIRSGSGGRFWCAESAVYLSASDFSDPRSNGSRYELLVRTEHSAALPVGRIAALLILGGVLLLGSGTHRWWMLAGSALLVCIVAASGRQHLRAWKDIAQLGQHAESWTQSDLAPVYPSALSARGQRFDPASLTLLPDSSLHPTGSRSFGAASEIVLTETTCGRQDGTLLHLPRDCAVCGTIDPPLSAREIGTVLLPLEIHNGNSLFLDLVSSDASIRVVTELPTPADTDVGEILVHNPFAGKLEDRDRKMTRVCVRNADLRTDLVGRFGPIELRSPLEAFEGTHGAGPVEIGDVIEAAYWQRQSGRTRLVAERGGTLKGRIGLITTAPRASSLVEIREVTDSPDSKVLVRLEVDSRMAWTPISVPVSPAGGTLEIVATSIDGDSLVAWSGLRIVPELPAPRRVVIILIDTLRADALGTYGHETNQTPALDGLAESGLRFERAISQSYWTRSSMASLFSGHYVPATGVHSTRDELPDSYETFPERFLEAGFQTVSVISNGNAGPQAGMDQGFQSVTLDFDTDTDAFLTRSVDPLLEELADEDVLLYIHLMEVHGPYGPDDAPEAYDEPSGRPLVRVHDLDQSWLKNATAEARRELYGRDVERLDAGLGRFLERLSDRWGNSGPGAPIIAVLSDHGESLGEQGQWGHLGRFLLTPELVQVPLILYAPGRITAGSVWAHATEIRILGPMLLALAVLPQGDEAALASAVPWPLSMAPGGEHGIALTSSMARHTMFSVFFGDQVALGRDDHLIQLRDASADASDPWGRLPGSYAEMAAYRKALSGFSTAALRHRAIGEQVRVENWKSHEPRSGEFDAATLEQLRQLGYLDSP